MREKRVWDLVSDTGGKVIVVGVPQTYPTRPVNGCLVSCFLTPDTKSDYTFPRELKQEIAGVVGDYMLDVPDFRTEDKDRLMADIYRMTEQRFALTRHLVTTKPWDFSMMVDMGADRIHHGFWKYFDKNHPKYVTPNPYESAIKDYYIFLDARVRELREALPEDAVVIVISDHGAKPMIGGVAINEWLIEQGYLTLEQYPAKKTPIKNVAVDWPKTKVWGEGGYYSRLFFNVKGREPQGTIEQADYEDFRNKIIAEISAMRDDNGAVLGNVCLKPEQLYTEVRGIAPDLFCYFGNLSWRSVGTIGLGGYITYENDTGPDDANHSFYGYFCMSGTDRRGRRDEVSIMNVAPTVLDILGIPIPSDIHGKIIA